ncbi:unnamed protein product [Rotaria socialis]|uniref:Potassium channel domain-containing protein n=3 Tax=Rotaria socialis TaxID=392032 RepID=A0A821IXV8_9BILA|nr:unnamed protein product [Rotaria socialis]CAF4139166.1 unnamed protein product [Rotaria socialis]CAF4705674.1 unnamed protein product [Rotaria socialis]
METTAYLHRVDSSSSARVVIVRHSNVKERPITSINSENNLQQPLTIVRPILTVKKTQKSPFNMRRRKAKDPSLIEDQRICTKENCLSCCKKFTAFMFSRVGLFFVMIGYVALGGWLFQGLEARNEQDMRRSMSEKLNSTLYKLWDEILRVNSYPYHDKRGNFTLYATEELEKFEATVIQQVQQGFDGRTRPGADPDWNYFGAILYAVTLVSTIGYGHITTKTVAGKIATVLYSAFGVPLMMLFVANIGSTMAKLFAFVFSRIKIIFCCRWRNKNKRVSLKKTPQQDDKETTIKIDEQQITKKSNLKQTKADQELLEKVTTDGSLKLYLPAQTDSSSNLPSQTNEISTSDTKRLPADIRLNMLTGAPTTMNKSRSLASSTNTVEERSKDALDRINELIRKNSVLDTDNTDNNEVCNDDDRLLTSTNQDRRHQLHNISSIEFYINETNKLTNNLESSLDDESIIKPEPEKSDNANIKQSTIPETTTTTSHDNTENSLIAKEIPKTKTTKQKLKRSKSESTHNRKSTSKISNEAEESPTINNNETTKSSRRRFFLCKTKKNSTDEINQNDSLEQVSTKIINDPSRKLARKSQSFDERLSFFPSPPDYEESTAQEIIPSPAVTWKPDNELYSAKATYDFPKMTHMEDDDEEYYEDEQMTVPLLVTVFVIPLYLTLGAILFNIWERWGFLNSFYFCFTTLTTIGFGDFVPGSSITVLAAKEKLICASLYILLGLVLIAMCFNLMKEQLSQKVKKIAGKWGILET